MLRSVAAVMVVMSEVGLGLQVPRRLCLPRGRALVGGREALVERWQPGPFDAKQRAVAPLGALPNVVVPSAVGPAVGLNCALAAVGVVAKQKSLTPSGLAHAWALGVILLSSSLGWRAYTTCVFYLVCGSAVTKVKKAQKEAEGIGEGRGGRRGPENVWGSAATAALCAMAATAKPTLAPTLAVAFVASLATKLSDTTQSEIGKAFGKTTYLVTTFKRVPRGTEGAVSLEGTLAGLVASVFIAAYAAAINFVKWSAVPVCVVAAFVGTTFESYLGALVQGRLPFLTNEVVNFLNTLVGAAAAVLLVR